MVLGIFLLGELAGQLMEKSIWYTCGAVAAFAVVLWRSSRLIAERKTRYSMLLLLLFGLGFVWNYGVRQHDIASNLRIREAAEKKKVILVEGAVSEIREGCFALHSGEGDLRILMPSDDRKTDGRDADAGEYREADETEKTNESRELRVGDRVKVSGIPERIPSATNPGAFDSREYYESEGILWQMRPTEITVTEKGGDVIRSFLGKLRDGCRTRLESILPEKEAGVLSAMLLGERAGVDSELKELYRRNGIAHILAISGLHVSLIGAALMALLGRLGASRRAVSLVTILFLLFYGALTGFAPATMRAIWMLTTVCLAGMFLRTADLPTSAGGALFLILVVWPYRATSSGMLMSFLAVCGVIAEGELFRSMFAGVRFLSLPTRLRSPAKKLVGMLLFGLVLQCFLQPVLMRDYYAITPYGMLLNLIVIPLLTIAICSGVLGLLLGLLPGMLPVAEAVTFPCKWILRFYEWLCRNMSEVPGSEIVTGHITTTEMLVLLLLGAVLIWFLVKWLGGRRGRLRLWICYPVTLLVLLLFLAGTAGYAMIRNRMQGEAVFLDVGQGDGCLVHTKKGADLMIDGGSSSKNDIGKWVLLPAMRYYGISSLDGIFVSHSDEDHINGIVELLEAGKASGVCVEHLFLAKGTQMDEGLERLLSAAEKAGTGVIYLAEGDVVEVEDVRIEVLLPLRNTEGSGNEFSLVVQLSLPGGDILCTGDIGEETEEELVKVMEVHGCAPEILKVPHHGSRYSSSEMLLNYHGWSGALAVISCGRNNRYGHPAAETLERLEEAGFMVYRTDLQGAVILDLP